MAGVALKMHPISKCAIENESDDRIERGPIYWSVGLMGRREIDVGCGTWALNWANLARFWRVVRQDRLDHSRADKKR